MQLHRTSRAQHEGNAETPRGGVRKGQEARRGIKAAYLALGVYDLVVHVEAPNEETVAKFVLSLAAMGNLRTTTVRLFAEGEMEKIVGGLV